MYRFLFCPERDFITRNDPCLFPCSDVIELNAFCYQNGAVVFFKKETPKLFRLEVYPTVCFRSQLSQRESPACRAGLS